MTPERSNRLHAALQKRQTNITVVLENVFDPHNRAAVMRTCDAVGIQDVYLINNGEPPKKRWGFKSSSGAKKWLTLHEYSSVEACYTALRNGYDKILTTHLSDKSVSLFEIDFTGSMALVFGNERFGVSDEAKDLADGSFIIPQSGIIKSLNISVACAVTLYEAYRQKLQAGDYNHQSLPQEVYNNLLARWSTVEPKQT